MNFSHSAKPYKDRHQELTLQKDKEFLSKLAKRIHNSGLITPAIFFLEMAKPLSLLGSHVLVFFGPIINAFIQSETYYRKLEIFQNTENVEYLLTMIEEIEINER